MLRPWLRLCIFNLIFETDTETFGLLFRTVRLILRLLIIGLKLWNWDSSLNGIFSRLKTKTGTTRFIFAKLSPVPALAQLSGLYSHFHLHIECTILLIGCTTFYMGCTTFYMGSTILYMGCTKFYMVSQRCISAAQHWESNRTSLLVCYNCSSWPELELSLEQLSQPQLVSFIFIIF